MIGRLERILKGFGRGLITAGLAASMFYGCSDEDKVVNTTPKPTPIQENRAPVINSSPVTNISEKEYYGYSLKATDPDGDALTYILTKGPSWLTVYNYGHVNGPPPEVVSDQTSEVEVTVSDGKLSAKQSWFLTVKNVSNTYLLSASQLTGATVDENSVSLSQPAPAGFVAGDIIGAGITPETPYGLLREIISVSSDKKSIQTKQATLDQPARYSFVTHVGRLPNPSISGTTPFLIEGASIAPKTSGKYTNFNIKLNNVVLYDEDGNHNTKDDQLAANGNISFDTDLIFNVNVYNYQIKDIAFKNITDIESNVTVGSNVIGLALSQKIKIFEHIFEPIVAGTFPPPVLIPIIIVPKLGVYVSINPVNINPLSVRVQQNANLEIGVTYSNINGWAPISKLDIPSPTFSNPAISGDLELKVAAGPQLDLMLYGIAGPFADVNGRLRFKILNGGQDWELYGGWGASAGVKANIIGKNISAQFSDVINYEKLIAESKNLEPTDTLIIQPGPEGKDAYVRYILWPDGSKSYLGSGDTELLELSREYAGSHGTEEEALLEFPVSPLPQNSKISSAKLKVYGYAVTNHLTDKPTITLSKLLGSWEESGVKWDTKPLSSIISKKDFVNEGTLSWYEFDVTSIVQAWTNGESNYGFGFSTGENDVHGKIHSGDNPDATKRPLLKILYTP